MKKILITGASGFIGRGILENLIENKEHIIYAVTTDKVKLLQYENSANIVEVNLLDEEAVKLLIESVKPDILLHLAWKLEGNDGFQNSSDNITWLKASLSLIEEAVKNNVKRIIFAGSSSEYNYAQEPLKESDNMTCLNLYGKCKKAVTDICNDYCKVHGVQFVTARFFSVYGRYDNRASRAIPEAIKSFSLNKPFNCKSPYNKWDYIYIDDAANAVIKLIDSNYTGIVNIASGKAVTMKEIFELIAKLMHKEELLFLDETNKKSLCLTADNNILTTELNYKCKIDLAEGISRTMDWFLENKL